MRWILLVAIAAGACATGYHSGGFAGGYSETKINDRSYFVTFKGNGYTAAERAHRGALRRAAELTIASGFSAFDVMSQEKTASSYTDPVTCQADSGSATCRGGDTVIKPASNLTIIMLTPPEAADAASKGRVIYDASLILGQTNNL